MKAPRLASLLVILLITALPGSAVAHDSRPLFIEIKETADGAVRLNWKTPPSVAAAQAPVVSLSNCDVARENANAGRLQGLALYTCADGLAAATLRIDYPLYNPSISSLVRIEFSSGETRSVILGPAQSEWRIPRQESFADVAKSYFVIGVDHILGGIDHLLFLAGLLYIARTPRRVLITITGFTVAHSLTIFLVALNVVRVSVPAVETVIALSIVFLATEIARNDRTSLTWQRPIFVAGGFGLIHGAGFAAGLSEIGLPQIEKLSALVFFNLGVEAGQLGVVLAIFAAGWALSKSPSRTHLSIDTAPLRPTFSYALGIISALWFIERLAGALA